MMTVQASGTSAVVESTLRAAMAERLGESRFGLWFGEGVRLGVADDALEVAVPNAFFRDWIQGHFSKNLIEAAHEVTGRSLRLAFRVHGEAETPLGNVVDLPILDPGPAPRLRAQISPGEPAYRRSSCPPPPTAHRSQAVAQAVAPSAASQTWPRRSRPSAAV